jgi:hypothetical protein
MRILEAGLVQLGRALSIEPTTNWNNALNQIEKEIRARSMATHGPVCKKDEAFFAEAATHFRAVKNAWRNHTMHGREAFDEERSRVVFESTAALMRHLSEKLSEKEENAA